MSWFSYLRICDGVANCPAPSWLDSSISRALHRYVSPRWWVRISFIPAFFQATFCVYNRDEVFHGILIITVIEIPIVYDDSVETGQCTIKVQEHSRNIWGPKRSFRHSPIFSLHDIFKHFHQTMTVNTVITSRELPQFIKMNFKGPATYELVKEGSQKKRHLINGKSVYKNRSRKESKSPILTLYPR